MQNLPNNISVLFLGNWSPNNVFVKEVDSTRVIDHNLEARCKQTWDAMLVEAAQTNKKLWDCDVYRFESMSNDSEKLNLFFSTIPFSVRLGMNMHTNEIKKLGITYASQGIFTSCFVRTSDNMYIFIEKSEHYFTHKKISFVGGIVSKSERVLTSGKDLFKGVEKEVLEEIGVSARDIRDIHLRIGYRSENFNVCLLFEVLVSLAFSEVLKLFTKNHDDEAKKIIGFSVGDITPHLSSFEPKDTVKFRLLELV